jgi:hypothetical protein
MLVKTLMFFLFTFSFSFLYKDGGEMTGSKKKAFPKESGARIDIRTREACMFSQQTYKGVQVMKSESNTSTNKLA